MNLKYPSSNPVFLIGTSGKGLKHLFTLAESLPKNFPAPFIFLLHRVKASPIQHNINDIFKSRSNLDVQVIQDGQELQPGTIYLPERDSHVILSDRKAKLSKEPENSRWRPSIDCLFISGARDLKASTVSILLSGDMDDGVEGLIETTKQGGVTVAQSPEDAYNPVLPLNALLKDHPNYVLPLRDMPALFCELLGYGCYENQKDISEKAAEAAARQRTNK